MRGMESSRISRRSWQAHTIRNGKRRGNQHVILSIEGIYTNYIAEHCVQSTTVDIVMIPTHKYLLIIHYSCKHVNGEEHRIDKLMNFEYSNGYAQILPFFLSFAVSESFSFLTCVKSSLIRFSSRFFARLSAYTHTQANGPSMSTNSTMNRCRPDNYSADQDLSIVLQSLCIH